MSRTPLDQYDGAAMAALWPMQGSGIDLAMWLHANEPLVSLPNSRSPYLFECVLWSKQTVYGQDMGACSIGAQEEHGPGEDVFAVTSTQSSTTKRWYRAADGVYPVVWSLYSTLEWVQTSMVSPGAPLLLRTEGGGDAEVTECTQTDTGDQPENWDGFDPQPGYIFRDELDLSEGEDLGWLTGSAMASAGMGGEVMLSESDWMETKRFGRQWAQGNTTVFAGAVAECLPTRVRRFRYELVLVGWRVASTLKWTERTGAEGGAAEVTERSLPIDADTGWAATIDIPYPPYGSITRVEDLRIVPI